MKKIVISLLYLFLLCGCASEKVVELPEDCPTFTVRGKSNIKGDYLAEINGAYGFYLLRFSQKGNLIWYKKINDFNNKRYGYCTHFKKATSNPDRYFYFEIMDLGKTNYDNELVILDENYEVLHRTNYLLNGAKYSVDNHDALVFDENHYIIATARTEKVDNIPEREDHKKFDEANVQYIQEVEDGKIKWEFRSADYPEFYTYKEDYDVSEYVHFQDDYSDYMHFNSFAIDPKDQNLLVSFRNQGSIVKLNRENGEVMWIMGGKGDEFHLPEHLFACQHSISFTQEGNLLMYNNNYEGINSSILELAVDEENRSVEIINQLPLEADTINYGSVQKLNKDTYLVHYGQTFNLDLENGFYELDAKTGEVKFAINCEQYVNNYFAYKVLD